MTDANHKAPAEGEGSISDVLSEKLECRTLALDAALADVDRLKLAICGGEDVPGAINAVTVEDCEGFIREERARSSAPAEGAGIRGLSAEKLRELRDNAARASTDKERGDRWHRSHGCVIALPKTQAGGNYGATVFLPATGTNYVSPYKPDPAREADFTRHAVGADPRTVIQLVEEILALRACSSAPEAREEALGNLLAVIHGDGGHRALEVGTKQAALEAEKIVAGLFAAPSADKLRIASAALAPFAALAPCEETCGVNMNDPLSKWLTIADLVGADQALAALKAEAK